MNIQTVTLTVVVLSLLTPILSEAQTLEAVADASEGEYNSRDMYQETFFLSGFVDAGRFEIDSMLKMLEGSLTPSDAGGDIKITLLTGQGFEISSVSVHSENGEVEAELPFIENAETIYVEQNGRIIGVLNVPSEVLASVIDELPETGIAASVTRAELEYDIEEIRSLLISGYARSAHKAIKTLLHRVQDTEAAQSIQQVLDGIGAGFPCLYLRGHGHKFSNPGQ